MTYDPDKTYHCPYPHSQVPPCAAQGCVDECELLQPDEDIGADCEPYYPEPSEPVCTASMSDRAQAAWESWRMGE
jgi:hypothetical protein